MKSVRDHIVSCWTPPDRQPIYDWARENVKLSQAYTIQGHFDIGISRYLIEPFDALANDIVRQVVIVAPVRSGKSMVADVWVPWIVANDPGPCMWNMQTDIIAKRHSETRCMPMLRMCDASAAYFPDDRHKVRAQEIIFSHGMPLWVQGPSIGNLQSTGIRYQINDEVWCWEPGRLAQALARLGDFESIGSSKVLIISQAGMKDDDLDAEFQRGQRAEWSIQCQGCGKHVPAVFAGKRQDGSRWGMRWDETEASKDKLGNWIVATVLPTVRWECRECGHPHLDNPRTRAEWNRTGKFEATAPAPAQIRSYHWEAVITRQWSALVEEWLLAMNALRMGVVDQLQVFLQKRRALPWSEDWHGSDSTTHTVQPGEWADEWVRIMTVDRQAEGVHWGMVRGWSKAGECRQLWYGKLYSEEEIELKRSEFKVLPNRVLIDSGFDSKLVYAMCVRHGWISLKGDEHPSFAHSVGVGAKRQTVMRSYSQPVKADPEIGTTHAGRRFATLIRWSNPTIKDRLQRHIDSGRWTDNPPDEANDIDKAYRQQMRGQWKKRVVDKVSGRQKWIWCDNGNDHARDCACMQVLAATLLRILPDNVAEKEVM